LEPSVAGSLFFEHPTSSFQPRYQLRHRQTSFYNWATLAHFRHFPIHKHSCSYSLSAHLYRTWAPAGSYKNPHKWKGTLGTVSEKRTYLKWLFYKADSKYIVSEAGSPEQGIKKSGYQAIRLEDKEQNSENRISDFCHPTSEL